MKANQLDGACGRKKKKVLEPGCERRREKVSNIDDPLNWFFANDPITQTHNNGPEWKFSPLQKKLSHLMLKFSYLLLVFHLAFYRPVYRRVSIFTFPTGCCVWSMVAIATHTHTHIKLTNHKEGNGKVFPSGRPHGPEDCSNNCAADADEGDHDDKPTDGNRLRHHHPATRFAALFAGVHRSPRSAWKIENWHLRLLFIYFSFSVAKTRVKERP